jgi:hypothetical protein
MHAYRLATALPVQTNSHACILACDGLAGIVCIGTCGAVLPVQNLGLFSFFFSGNRVLDPVFRTLDFGTARCLLSLRPSMMHSVNLEHRDDEAEEALVAS